MFDLTLIARIHNFLYELTSPITLEQGSAHQKYMHRRKFQQPCYLLYNLEMSSGIIETIFEYVDYFELDIVKSRLEYMCLAVPKNAICKFRDVYE